MHRLQSKVGLSPEVTAAYQGGLLFCGKKRSQLGRERSGENEAREHPAGREKVALQGVWLVSHLAHQQGASDVGGHPHSLRSASNEERDVSQEMR